jgi:hypothetical protein
VLDFGFGLLVLASGLSSVSVELSSGRMKLRAYLVGIATDERAQSGLGGARGRVDVRLESGSVLVRHVVGCDGGFGVVKLEIAILRGC